MIDIKNLRFHVKKDLLQLKEKIKTEHWIKIAMNGDQIYGIFTMSNFYNYDSENDNISDVGSSDSEDSFSKFDGRVWEEIRTFKIEKDVLVETGVKWKNSERIEETGLCYPWVNSSLFVQHVKLN